MSNEVVNQNNENAEKEIEANEQIIKEYAEKYEIPFTVERSVHELHKLIYRYEKTNGVTDGLFAEEIEKNNEMIEKRKEERIKKLKFQKMTITGANIIQEKDDGTLIELDLHFGDSDFKLQCLNTKGNMKKLLKITKSNDLKAIRNKMIALAENSIEYIVKSSEKDTKLRWSIPKPS